MVSYLSSDPDAVRGLPLAVLALTGQSVSAFTGCLQRDMFGGGIGEGWYWIDGTVADNLNCGMEGAGGTGCGLWGQGEPE